MSGLELNVRDTLLTLVILLTLLVNLVLAVATLSKALSLYTLLVYLIVIGALNALVGSGLLTQEDVVDAMDRSVYPPRMRLPMRLQFAPIVGLWLLWWFVSQAFFETDMVFGNGFFVQLVLLPVVLATFAARSVFNAHQRFQLALTSLLAVITLISLFLPTRDWAPQYTSALSTVIRVVLYFALVSLLDYVQPPQRYGDMVAHRSADNRELARLNNMFAQLEGGANEPTDVDGERMAQIRSVVAAYSCVRDESQRVMTIAVLAGWLLVTPLAFALLGFPLLVIATVVGRRPVRRAPKLPVVVSASQPSVSTPSGTPPPSTGSSSVIRMVSQPRPAPVKQPAVRAVARPVVTNQRTVTNRTSVPAARPTYTRSPTAPARRPSTLQTNQRAPTPPTATKKPPEEISTQLF